MTRHYQVLTASAKMPGNCWGTYRRVALVEVASPAVVVKMISPRAKGVIRIVQTWERRNVGSSSRCAYQVAYRAALDLMAALNRSAA